MMALLTYLNLPSGRTPPLPGAGVTPRPVIDRFALQPSTRSRTHLRHSKLKSAQISIQPVDTPRIFE
jgi:hypothetical protein